MTVAIAEKDKLLDQLKERLSVAGDVADDVADDDGARDEVRVGFHFLRFGIGHSERDASDTLSKLCVVEATTGMLARLQAPNPSMIDLQTNALILHPCIPRVVGQACTCDSNTCN